jgi:SAM-dependent methyltransferase
MTAPENTLNVDELPDYAQRNRESWTAEAANYVEAAERGWAGDPDWGIWSIPESQVGMLGPIEQLKGIDAIELGCGAGYVSSWLARAGARVTGVDITPAQLDTARRLQEQHGTDITFIEASAEAVPLPDASFDYAISEYGASIWCDPDKWIPEAGRLLRLGGRLAFLVNSPLMMLCTPPDALADEAAGLTLCRPQFGMKRFEWPDDDGIDFHIPHGEMIDVLHSSGFQVERLIELRPHDGATTRYEFVTYEWARNWPCEEVWIARRV